MSDFTNAGNEIGGFLGGIFSPILGGTTNTTVTENGGGSKGGSNNTVIIIAVVLILAVVGYFIFKPKKTVS